MSILDWFNKQKQQKIHQTAAWIFQETYGWKCPTCKDTVYLKELEEKQ